jgi:hypothetical protein
MRRTPGLGRHRALVLANLTGVVLSASLLTAGPASATTTVGANPASPSSRCLRGPVFTDLDYVVPQAGQIVSFAYQSVQGSTFGSSQGNQLEFKVLRPAGGTTYTVVGVSGVKTLQTGSDLETFPVTPIAVQAGDLIGFYAVSIGLVGCVDTAADGNGGLSVPVFPNPQPGTALTFVFPQRAGNRNVSAQLEPSAAQAQCNDRIDNDGDGKIDFGPNPNHNDPNCKSGDDNGETPECRDQVDNDRDGKTDWSRNRFHRDPDCRSANDDSEAPDHGGSA